MQLYVLDRSKNTLESTSDFYNEKHLRTLGAGGATFDFTIDKTDDAAAYMDTGNYVVFQDDRGRGWSFNIINYDENQLTKTVYCEDTSLGLLNKAMDVWANMGNHAFEYYFDLVTKDTPWTLGINQVSGLSRTLTYTGRDTGLGRLLSVLTAFDHAECKFNVKIKQNQPVEFVVDVYKQIGTVQENIQIVHDVELNDITKKESRAAFVTAIQGVGGTIEQESDGTTVTTVAEEQHVDFTDLEYDDGDYFTVKGDPFLRARTANKKFNPNQENSYIEDFYDYDTQDPQELLNRTLTQLKTYSEPQYTYDADVQVIDPTLEIGDTVTIIDHDYNPALYLSARVATLEKCYSDPTQNKITFTNYQILNSKIDDKIRAMQNIINEMPSSSSIQAITTNLANIKNTIDDLTVKLAGANGKNSNYYGPDEPTDAQQGDTWFQDAGDGKTVIKQFVDGGWKTILDTSLTDDINTQLEDAKKDIAAAQKTANDAVAQATLLATQFQEQTKTVNALNDAVVAAKNDASVSLASATKAISDAATAMTDAQTALDNVNDNSQKLVTIQSDLDTVNGTLKTLATQQFVDELNKTVTTVQTLSEQTAEGLKQKVDQTTVDTLNKTVTTQSTSLETALNQLKLKADTTTVNGLNDSVTKLTGDLTTASDQLKLMATKTELTNATSGLATQNYVDSQLSVEAGKINSTVQAVQNQVNNSAVGTNLLTNTGDLNANWFLGSGVTVDTGQKPAVLHYPATTLTSSFKVIALQQLNDGLLQPSTTYTASFYAKGTGTFLFYCYSNVSAGAHSDTRTLIKLTSEYKLYTITFTTLSNVSGNKTLSLRQDYSPSVTDQNTVEAYVYGLKLEKGSVATDWCPNPADNASVTALTSVTQTLTQIQQMASDNKGNLTTLTTTVNGNQTSVTNAIEGLTTEQTTLAGQYTSVTKSVDGLSSKLTQTVSDMNLRVQKNDIINQINLSTESILISGNKVHITGQTTIDSGLITNAMIKDGSINNAKIVDATIASAKIANLDGSKIVANSITADKLAVNAIQVGMGNYLSTIKLSPDDINFYVAGKSYSSLRLNGNGMYVNDVHNGEQVAWFTADSWITGDTNYNGLQINLYDNADTFSINNINDKTSGAAMSSILFWSRSAQENSGIELGFNFYDFVTFNKSLIVQDKIWNRWGDVNFHVTNYNGAGVALINDAGAGVCFGNDGHLYFLNKNKYVDSVEALNISGV